MARKYRIRVYDIQFATLLTTLADSTVWSGMCDISLTGEDSLTFRADKDAAEATNLAIGRVVELHRVDESWKRPFRIVGLKPVREGSKYFYDLECEHLKYDLAYEINLFTGDLINQTPTTHLNFILNGSGWTAGTVTPTAALTKNYNNNTRLFDLQELAEKTGYELSFAATAGGARTVSLVRVGNQSSTATITFAKNLKTLNRDVKIPEANRVYGIGGDGGNSIGMTIALATHRITNAIGLGGFLMQLVFDSDKVVPSDDSWVGYEVRNITTGSWSEIYDSFKFEGDYDRITVEGSGWNVGDIVRIGVATADSFQYVDYIEDQSSIDTYGLRSGKHVDESFSDVINIAGPYKKSALSGTYTSGLCESWFKVGTCTVAENTDSQYVTNGTKSQKVTVTAWTTTPSAPAITHLTDIPTEIIGTRQYKIAWLVSDGEGPLSAAASVALNKTAARIELNQAAPETRITGWRVYATKANGSTFYRLADLAIAATEFYDTVADDNLTIEPPVSTAAAAGGQGVYCEFTAVEDEEYSAVVYLTVASGRVRVELATADSFPGRDISSEKAATPAVTSAENFIISIDGVIASGTSGRLSVVAHEGSAVFYVDSVMVVKSAYAPSSDRFVADNMATELWYETYDELQKRKVAQTQWSIGLSDLYEMGIGTDQIMLGDTLTVTDTALGISNAAVRVLRKSFSIVQPNEATFEFTNSTRRLSDFLKDTKRRQQIFSRALQRRVTALVDSVRAQQGTARAPVLRIAAAAKVNVSGDKSGWELGNAYID